MIVSPFARNYGKEESETVSPNVFTRRLNADEEVDHHYSTKPSVRLDGLLKERSAG
jgi:hypothetical protein